jgi:hypothetical protein
VLCAMIEQKRRSPSFVLAAKMDDTGIEPGTSRMLSACDNQLHQTPKMEFGGRHDARAVKRVILPERKTHTRCEYRYLKIK